MNFQSNTDASLITLVGGNSPQQGNVFSTNPTTQYYGPVCDDGWTLANVILSQRRLSKTFLKDVCQRRLSTTLVKYVCQRRLSKAFLSFPVVNITKLDFQKKNLWDWQKKGKKYSICDSK